MQAKPVVRVVLTTCVTILICLVTCELGVRLFSVFYFPKLMQIDSKLGWRHTPSAKKIFINEYGEEILVVQNESGHRGRLYPLKRSNNKYRVLVLGDSFTEGVQVSEDDLFTARMERTDEILEVINTGVGGYGTVQEYLYFQAEGALYSPDAVVLMFFNNDLDDNCLTHYPAFGPRPYARLKENNVQIVEKFNYDDYRKFALQLPYWRTLNQYSYFYNFLNTRLYQRLMAQKMREYSKADLQSVEDCGRYRIFLQMVEKLHYSVKKIGAELVLILIPSKEDIMSGRSTKHKTILEFCREKNYTCQSLADVFKNEVLKGSRPYFQKDIHWTKYGHKVVADVLTDMLKQQRVNKRRGYAEQQNY